MDWNHFVLHDFLNVDVFSIKLSITIMPYKNFAEKKSTLKGINQDTLRQASCTRRKDIRLRQKVIIVMMLHRGFIPHMVHKTDQLTWQMIWQRSADQNWEFLQGEQQLSPHKLISENGEKKDFNFPTFLRFNTKQ